MNVVGIDVGGARKGFHAVAISDGTYLSHFTTQDVEKYGREWSRWMRLVAGVGLVMRDLLSGS